MNSNHIFIDTNVLIGYFAGKTDDKNALQYLFSMNGKRLFTSSLAIAQFVAIMQKKKNLDVRESIKWLMHKIDVLSFSKDDILKAEEMLQKDLEDNMQYVVGSKMKCFYYVTNNIHDYSDYINIKPIRSCDVRLIRR